LPNSSAPSTQSIADAPDVRPSNSLLESASVAAVTVLRRISPSSSLDSNHLAIAKRLESSPRRRNAIDVPFVRIASSKLVRSGTVPKSTWPFIPGLYHWSHHKLSVPGHFYRSVLSLVTSTWSILRLAIFVHRLVNLCQVNHFGQSSSFWSIIGRSILIKSIIWSVAPEHKGCASRPRTSYHQQLSPRAADVDK
jgi:hypothetical protein